MTSAPSLGPLLRRWREHRRLTQLELALQAEVSTRHLSFLETGRAAPSRDMLLHLADHLEVPLRERNQLLLAAGYAPVYPQTKLDAPRLTSVRQAVRDVLDAHEPYPALVVDRHWNLVDANQAVTLFTNGVAPELTRPPVNVMRLSLHPRGAAPRIVNYDQWRAHLLGRLRREIAQTADADLVQLYEEVKTYQHEGDGATSVLPLRNPGSAELSSPADVVPVPNPGTSELPVPTDVVVPLHFRAEGKDLVFFSMVAAFGTPLDITVAELALELFFPANAATAEALRGRHG